MWSDFFLSIDIFKQNTQKRININPVKQVSIFTEHNYLQVSFIAQSTGVHRRQHTWWVHLKTSNYYSFTLLHQNNRQDINISFFHIQANIHLHQHSAVTLYCPQGCTITSLRSWFYYQLYISTSIWMMQEIKDHHVKL